MRGWVTQIFSREFDTALEKLPRDQRALILEKITEMGRRYRVIYRFQQDAVLLVTLGHRREIYR